MESSLSVQEQEIVKNFIEEQYKLSQTQNPNNASISWNTAVKFLMARKFDLSRALALYDSHENVRQKEGLSSIDLGEEIVRRELLNEKFTILPGRDTSGAALALFTVRLHDPIQSTHQLLLKALVFQLDAALESIETQRNGLVFIYDMSHAKYHNFDYELSSKILNLLKGSYPARLKKVLIVNAPIWFKWPFKCLRVFVREKLRDRVHMVSFLQLASHIPVASLPTRLGGTLVHNHQLWLSNCLSMTWKNLPDCDRKIASYLTTANSQMAASGDWEIICRQRLNAFCQSNDTLDFRVDVDDDQKSPFSTSSNCKTNWKTSNTGSLLDTSPMDCLVPVLSAEQCSVSSPVHGTSRGAYDVRESLHVPNSDGFTVQELVDYCNMLGPRELARHYAMLKAEPSNGTFEASKLKSNLNKNRYADVLCLDESRVRLKSADASDEYINANFVDGYRQKNAYICTQGPLTNTIVDFWRMILDYNVLVIVMATRTFEGGRAKCSQYWPSEEESSDQHGCFAVINNGVEVKDGFTVTSLIIQNTRTIEMREVTHMQFTGWPDYGVPHSSDQFLTFMFSVRDKQKERMMNWRMTSTDQSCIPPIVVHCSAGIGRSGTFVAMDINTRRLADTGRVDVHQTICRIRSQRASSIQMPDQYIFCHTALIEHAQKQGILSNDVVLLGFNP